MKTNAYPFNVGTKFMYSGKLYKIAKKSGYPACRSIRLRCVDNLTDKSGGFFFLDELREWLAAGLIEIVK